MERKWLYPNRIWKKKKKTHKYTDRKSALPVALARGSLTAWLPSCSPMLLCWLPPVTWSNCSFWLGSSPSHSSKSKGQPWSEENREYSNRTETLLLPWCQLLGHSIKPWQSHTRGHMTECGRFKGKVIIRKVCVAHARVSDHKGRAEV